MFFKVIQNILKSREEQLDKQKVYDSKLNLIKDKCPLVVINFLLYERELNRIQQKEYDECSIKEYISLMYKNLSDIDKSQKILDKIFNSKNICNELKIFILNNKNI